MSELSDRELDVQIAERLFGIKKIFKPSDYVAGRDALYGSDEPSWIPSGKSPRTHMIDATPIPCFSTDISAAMKVVEKMRELEYFPKLWAAQMWNVEFWTDGKFIASANEDSLPRAICEAALAALSPS